MAVNNEREELHPIAHVYTLVMPFVCSILEHVNSIVAKLNRAQIKGHKVKVKVA